LITSYYLFQRVTGDPFRPDPVGFVAVFGFVSILVSSVSTLTLGAVGRKLGTHTKMR
jgi:cbb3-type cytochrome oxidase subunit 1